MSYGVRQLVPSEFGQTAIAVLVAADEGIMLVVALDFGVEDTDGSELLLSNGAHADSNSMITRTGSKRRGICIGNSYLSCITVSIKLVSIFDNLF